MRRAVVIDAVRSPIARASSETGWFRDVRADDLSAQIMRALVDRVGVDPTLIDDVQWGCVQQQGEQGFNIARNAALAADLPVETSAATVNRLCASSLQAINNAAMNIAAECEDVQIAGGVEHMDHLPMSKDYNPSPKLFFRHCEAVMQMGLTAEYLALKYQIDRGRQDEFALRSHQLAAAATDSGKFKNEIIPIWGRRESGEKALIDQDQCIRRDTSMESLSKLPPAFNPAGGSVTAGNSSPMNVGAAALLIMSEETARRLGLKPMARIRAMATAGVNPEEMGIGPVPAVHKALRRAGLKLDDVDCMEFNEAFAVQVLAVGKLLGLDLDRHKVNLRGGAVALGHPLGGSGARIATTLLHRMRDEGARFGLATMCVGGGQGVCTIFEACGE
jgi:acetyl-CoA acyltransferase